MVKRWGISPGVQELFMAVERAGRHNGASRPFPVPATGVPCVFSTSFCPR